MAGAARKHLRIRVRGDVQGVGFRAATMRTAEELCISGTVCNEADGSVLIEAEGDSASLHALVEWCRRGPRFARVDSVQSDESEPVGYTSFQLKH